MSDETPAPEVMAPAASEGSELRKKELIDMVVARSGVRKRDAKPVIEAMLAVLGQAIADGRDMTLNPLGKVRINSSRDKPDGRVTVVRLRQSTAKQRPKDPLADPGVDG